MSITASEARRTTDALEGRNLLERDLAELTAMADDT
jgi:hypothetical protein